MCWSQGATYANAVRYQSNQDGPGLSVDGHGRGCNTSTGSFTVNQGRFNATDEALESIDLTFEQHCEGAKPAMRGRIAFGSLAQGEISDDPADPFPTTASPDDAPRDPSPAASSSGPLSPGAAPPAPASGSATSSTTPPAAPTTAPTSSPDASPPATITLNAIQPTRTPSSALSLVNRVSARRTTKGTRGLAYLRITNPGTSSLMFHRVALAGRFAPDWAVLGGCPARLKAGQSCILRLQFRPSRVGSLPVTLVLTTTAGIRRVALNGTAV